MYILLRVFQYNQGPAFEPFAVEDMPHMHRIVYDMYQEIVAEMNARQQVNSVCEGPRSANDLEILAFSPLFGA